MDFLPFDEWAISKSCDEFVVLIQSGNELGTSLASRLFLCNSKSFLPTRFVYVSCKSCSLSLFPHHPHPCTHSHMSLSSPCVSVPLSLLASTTTCRRVPAYISRTYPNTQSTCYLNTIWSISHTTGTHHVLSIAHHRYQLATSWLQASNILQNPQLPNCTTQRELRSSQPLLCERNRIT